MKLPVRVLCCVISCALCSTAFAQDNPPLSLIQAQSRRQVQENKWINNWLHYSLFLGGVPVFPFAGKQNIHISQLEQQWKIQTSQLEKEINSARGQTKSSLSAPQKNTETLWKESEKLLKKQSKTNTLPSRTKAAPASESYLRLARSPISKRLAEQYPYQLSLLSQGERLALFSHIDEVASKSTTRQLTHLHFWAREASSITARQLYIHASKYVKVIALTALFSSLLTPQNLQAQPALRRLENNPALFLDASPDELAEWEQDPQLNAFCRRIADSIDQAAALNITDEQSQQLLQIVRQEQIAGQLIQRAAAARQKAR